MATHITYMEDEDEWVDRRITWILRAIVVVAILVIATPYAIMLWQMLRSSR